MSRKKKQVIIKKPKPDLTRNGEGEIKENKKPIKRLGKKGIDKIKELCKKK